MKVEILKNQIDRSIISRCKQQRPFSTPRKESAITDHTKLGRHDSGGVRGFDSFLANKIEEWPISIRYMLLLEAEVTWSVDGLVVDQEHELFECYFRMIVMSLSYFLGLGNHWVHEGHSGNQDTDMGRDVESIKLHWVYAHLL